MIVVADSGPLHYLILLEQAELLHRFYDVVVIPEAVLEELSSSGAPRPVSDWLSAPPPWLHVEAVSPDQLGLVTGDLDRGEREAIALALRLRADLLLIDESRGRAEARLAKLRVTGTLGVLAVAARRGLIDPADILRRLRATNFYADERLIRQIFGES
jgi:predicted nucleic acid-binding protein